MEAKDIKNLNPQEFDNALKSFAGQCVRRLLTMQVLCEEFAFYAPDSAIEVHDLLKQLSTALEACEEPADDLAVNGVEGFN